MRLYHRRTASDSGDMSVLMLREQAAAEAAAMVTAEQAGCLVAEVARRGLASPPPGIGPSCPPPCIDPPAGAKRRHARNVPRQFFYLVIFLNVRSSGSF